MHNIVRMRRKESALVVERNSPVVERIKSIKAEHPEQFVNLHIDELDELDILNHNLMEYLIW